MKDYSNMICSGKMKNLFLFAFSIFLFSLIKRTNGQEELKCHPSCKTCQSNNFQEDDCTSCKFRNGGYILQPVKKDPRKVGKCIRSEECKYFEQYIFDQIEGYEPDEEIPCKSINDCRIIFNQYMEQYELDHEHPEDPINFYCVDCDETCLTCRGEGPNKCKFCNQTENKILNSTNASLVKEIWNMEEEELKEIFRNRQIPVGNCVEKCPDHEYSLKSNREDGFLYGSYCLPCDDNCLKCEAHSTNCSSCNASSEYKYLQKRIDLNFTDLNKVTYENRSVCQPHCMQGYYPDENNICQPCNETCGACEGGKAEDCTYCKKEDKRILQYNEGVNFSKNPYTGKCIDDDREKPPENHSLINFKAALYSADGENYQVEEFEAYLPCDINCKKCGIRSWNNEYYCEECKPGFYWKETTNEIGMCTCLPGCKEGSCKDEIGCTECEEEKYFLNDEDHICHNCSLNCKTCKTSKSETSCDECYAPFIKNEDGKCDCNKTSCAECVYTPKEIDPNKTDQTGLGCVRCNTGYFLENHTCQQCEENCTDCTGIGECQKCIQNYVLEDGKCVPPEKEGCKEENKTNINCSECKTGYYLDDNVCRKCPFYCEECESEKICKKCKNEDVFEATEDGECVCKAPCEQCDYELGCLKCTIKDYYLKDGVCKNCSKNCETCDNETYCHSCYDNFILTEDHTCELPDPCLHDNGTEDKGCSQCRDGYYLSNYTCLKCNASCATCDSAEKCNTCKNDTIFDMKEDKCVCKEPCEVCQEGVGCQRCPSTDYFLKDGICQNCTKNCKICNNGDTCIECYENFELTSEGKCEMPDSCSNHTEDEGCSACKEGYYLNNYTCLPCNASCAICESAEKCTKCKSDDIFTRTEDYKCICKEPCEVCQEGVGCLKCPSLDYFLKDRICHTCIENCKICENGKTCIKCYDNFILNSEGKCEMPEPCSNYTEDDGCTSCNDGFYLQDKQCLKCHESCSKCDIKADNCSECKDNNIFTHTTDNKCVCKEPCEECKEGFGCLRCPKKEYFLEGGICSKCPTNCETCTSTKECTSCDIGYELSNGVCKSKDPCDEYTIDKTGCKQCKERYFLKEGECYDCSNNCLNCNSAQDCTKCEDGFYVYEHACKECPANAVCTDNKVPNSCKNPDAYYFYDGQCRSCDKTSCDTCQDAKGCVKCRDKFFLDNTVTLGGTCRPCQTNCITCDEGFACRKCVIGYYLENNQCLNCPEHCDSCINGESCEICSDNYVKNQYKGIIGTTQGIHEWEINNDCVSCPTECKLCTDNFCQACVKGYELYDHKCRRIVEDDDDDDKKVKKILLGTLIPMGIILIAFIVLLILFFKKNQAAGGGDAMSYNPSTYKSSTNA